MVASRWSTGVLLATVAATRAAFNPVELIDVKGRLNSAGLDAHLKQHASAVPKLTIVSAVGAPGCGKERLLNDLFRTSFDSSLCLPGSSAAASKPLCVASVCAEDPSVLLLGSDATPGADAGRVAALHAQVAGVVLVHLWQADVGRAVPANRRALRAILEQAQEVGKPTQLVVVVHDCAPEDCANPGASLAPSVTRELEDLWQELGIAGAGEADKGAAASLASAASVSVFALPSPEADSATYAAACGQLKAVLAPKVAACAANAGMSPEAAGKSLASRWAGAAPALPSKAELEALCAVDSAYYESLACAMPSLVRMRAAAEKGGVIGDLGAQAGKLIADAVQSFDEATSAVALGAALSARAARRASLVEDLTAEAEAAKAMMLASLTQQALKKFEAKLLGLVSKLKEPADPLPDDKAKKELRAASLHLASAAQKLALPFQAASKAGAVAKAKETDNFNAELAALLAGFDESGPCKVLRMNRLQRKVERAKKQPKQPRSIVPGFHLAAMMRQVGSGNLQGFAGYALGPHSIDFGYTNSRGDPELTGDKSPLLRLQPKVHFDIDL
mmetsp:Transcript_41201/g.92779  ORF Transcript_41201/g.92779 Transcript_41201/m.92779 type:complete len:563 (+) Transcript_41201:86-1774(+)